MAKTVKNRKQGSTRPKRNLTRISGKHQVTIPAEAFKSAGFETGDRLRVESAGNGRVVLTRLVDVLDELSGSLATGGELRRTIDAERDQWA